MPNHHVHFYLKDIYFPEAAQVLAELYGGELLEGRIIDLSNSAKSEDAFAVLEVAGIKQAVVVPVAKIVDFDGKP